MLIYIVEVYCALIPLLDDTINIDLSPDPSDLVDCEL